MAWQKQEQLELLNELLVLEMICTSSRSIAKIENLAAGRTASPGVGLRFMGILPCSLHWPQPPQMTGAAGKAPKMSYTGTVRSHSDPYVLSSSSRSKCCDIGNSTTVPSAATGCCQECRCCRKSYEHLPMPRLQQPHQVTDAMQQHQHQQQQQYNQQQEHHHQQHHHQQHQHQYHHQQQHQYQQLHHQQQPQHVSCITTLQHTTTTQQLQPFSCQKQQQQQHF
ncbi:GH17437 [Drosophila grimshawi]|uniref:GH17437 n=1 Tax=Drosophila grimshawi TaxID=7222 RepID=B4JVB5_DROGR|nr:GH17437 [Drosophila grimshawi]